MQEKNDALFVSTRRQLLCGLGATAVAGMFSGCGTTLNGISRTPLAGSEQPVPTGPLLIAEVTVSASTSGEIGDRFAGFSYEKSAMHEPLFTGKNDDLAALFQRLGPGLLRIGGNSVELTNWNSKGVGQTRGEVGPSDIDALVAFLRKTDWKVLYGLNLAKSTPELAASETAYAIKALGSSLVGIEIGNEPDLYQPAGYFAEFGYADYFALWSRFASAIQAQSPDVPLTGPAIGDGGRNFSTWTAPFADSLGKQEISLITEHYYRADGRSPSSTIELMLSPDNNLMAVNMQLQGLGQQSGIPWRLAETNSFFKGGASGVSNTYASALWVIDALFNVAIHGGTGVNLHGGGNGSGYTPIADNSGTVIEARPVYYGLLLFALAGTGQVLETSISAHKLNVTAYAVHTQSGTNVVIVNKDATQNLEVAITLPHSVQTATLMQMTGPALDATSGVAIQGAAVNPDGSFAPGAAYALAFSGRRIAAYVNAASAVLIQVS